ncbi:hypothetical protein QUF31_21655 [Dickeya chrysanthemi]|uniref:hypothetical protein n=1 Tax=Dickeya chrysanthemi TaxID=556 RepID=UPI0025A2A303|nr:hypothetical protein [Dickeya chrysanthemi]WJM85543.1 hypothetical protein QUF31_21655 [Dickeya chrysanthemi]
MKARLLIVVAVLTLTACATTTSPTGRRQVVGGVTQDQLDKLGAESFGRDRKSASNDSCWLGSPPTLDARCNRTMTPL